MEAITSFFDNIKQKVANPFFGTFIFVWLLRNWELVYTVFNFDKGSKLAAKKTFINGYLNSRDWTAELFNNVWISILVMLSGYILIVATRVLVNVIEHRIMPNLNKRTVSKLVTNTEVLYQVTQERDEVAEKYDKEKEKNRKLVALSDSQKVSYDEVISDKDKTIASERKEKEEIKKKNQLLAEEIDNQKTELERHDLDIKNLQEAIKEAIAKEAQAKFSLTKESIEKRISAEKYDTLEQIFLTAFKDYELFNEDVKKHLEKQIPDTITLPFESLKNQDIDKQFFQIADMLMTSNRLAQTSFDSGLIEKFEMLGLISIDGEATRKSYTGINVSLTELGGIVIKLKNILETKYSRRFD